MNMSEGLLTAVVVLGIAAVLWWSAPPLLDRFNTWLDARMDEGNWQ